MTDEPSHEEVIRAVRQVIEDYKMLPGTFDQDAHGYEHLATLECALAQLEASRWRPISGAPKDGAPFLGAICWDDTGEWEILRMAWIDHAGRFGDATYCPFVNDQEQPTCWQPLPSPPATASEGSERMNPCKRPGQCVDPGFGPENCQECNPTPERAADPTPAASAPPARGECECFGGTGLHASTHVPSGSDREHCDLCGWPVTRGSLDVLAATNEAPAQPSADDAAQPMFECAARRQGTAGGNDPADCDWPNCGCDSVQTTDDVERAREPTLLQRAEWLWEDLQKNELGGFSGINRPFWIVQAFKEVDSAARAEGARQMRERAAQMVELEAKHWPPSDDVQHAFVTAARRVRSLPLATPTGQGDDK